MHQPCVVRFAERAAGLHQEAQHSARGLRPVLDDQALEVLAVEQLHHVEERAVGRDAVVEQLDGVARTQRGQRLCFAPKSLLLLGRGGGTAVDANQLDGRFSRQQAVLGAPHLAHAALAQALDQAVAA
jgi:hypothetical protein